MRGILFLGAAAVLGAPAPDVSESLARVKAVGREGAGNAAAAAAWKRLAAGGPEVLPAVLAAMDDDNPLASNWLRTAVDAVAERTLAAGKPLPASALAAFVTDPRNARCARRLAYEWLVRADPQTPARLLPGMLHDPSAELRRDAVARATKDAQALLDKGDKAGAKAAFKKAFDAACDVDQVAALEKSLKALGEPVDLAAHYGFLRAWYLTDSFDNTGGNGFKTVYPPEKSVDLSATYKGKNNAEARWKPYRTDDPMGLVDLNKLLAKRKEAVAYAYAVVESPAERLVQVRAASASAVKVFVNGRQVLAKEEYHHGMTPDQYVGTAKLNAGRNELLVKVCQNNQTESWAQEWRFQLRLTDPAGATVPWTLVEPKGGAKP